jgi:hypothetical protein
VSNHVRVEATLRTLDDTTYIAPRTVVAIAPSSIDPVTDEMRVLVGGYLVSRPFDPGVPIDTDAPIAYVTKGGEAYVTKTAEPYVTKVQV